MGGWWIIKWVLGEMEVGLVVVTCNTLWVCYGVTGRYRKS